MTDSRVLTRDEVGTVLLRLITYGNSDERKQEAVKMNDHDAAQREEIDRLREGLKEVLAMVDAEHRPNDQYEPILCLCCDGLWKCEIAERSQAIRAEVFGQEGKQT